MVVAGAGNARPKGGEIGGNGRFDRKTRTGHRMVEGEVRSVQGVSFELEQRSVLVGERLIGAAREELGVGAVELVADHGAPERREVHADLVLSSGLEIARNEAIGSTVVLGAAQDREPRPKSDSVRRRSEPFGM